MACRQALESVDNHIGFLVPSGTRALLHDGIVAELDPVSLAIVRRMRLLVCDDQLLFAAEQQSRSRWRALTGAANTSGEASKAALDSSVLAPGSPTKARRTMATPVSASPVTGSSADSSDKGKERWTAEGAWPIGTVRFALLSSPTVPFGFCLLNGNERRVFTSDSEDSLTNWERIVGRAARHVRQASQQQLQQADLGQRPGTSSSSAVRSGAPKRNASQIRLEEAGRELSGLKGADWLLSIGERLDAYVGQHDLAGLTDLLLQGRETVSSLADSPIRRHLDTVLQKHTENAVRLLLAHVSAPLVCAEDMARLLGLLRRLGALERASSAHLDNASTAVSMAMWSVNFRLPLEAFVEEMVQVFVRHVSFHVQEHLRLFDGTGDRSAVVAWAVAQMQRLLAFFERHVFSRHSFATTCACVKTGLEQLGQLRELGLELVPSFIGAVIPELRSAADREYRMLLLASTDSVGQETWAVMVASGDGEGGDVRLCASTVHCARQLHKFWRSATLCGIEDVMMYVATAIRRVLQHLFEQYMRAAASLPGSSQAAERAVAVGNARYVAGTLVAVFGRRVRQRYGAAAEGPWTALQTNMTSGIQALPT
jgi:hypothetical protein